MEKSNIIEKMSKEDLLGKLKFQLDDAQKTAGKVEEHLAEARSILLAYTRKNSNLQYTNFCEMVLKSSINSERLTEKLRRLTLEVVLDTQKYEDYKSDLVLIHGIELEYTAGILKASMPVLIPHRKECYTDYLYKPLYTACQHWCIKRTESKEQIPMYERCTVCFVHTYAADLPLGRVRDHDNYEEKHVLDVLSNFFLRSDSGLWTNTFHTTRLGESDRTEVYVMDSNCFSEWIGRNIPKSVIEKDTFRSATKNDTAETVESIDNTVVSK